MSSLAQFAIFYLYFPLLDIFHKTRLIPTVEMLVVKHATGRNLGL
jgi:hypothetical protein